MQVVTDAYRCPRETVSKKRACRVQHIKEAQSHLPARMHLACVRPLHVIDTSTRSHMCTYTKHKHMSPNAPDLKGPE